MRFVLQKQDTFVCAFESDEPEEPAQRREARERVSELRNQLAQGWAKERDTNREEKNKSKEKRFGIEFRIEEKEV